MGIPHLASYLTQGDSTIIKRGHEHVYYMLGKLYHLSAAFEKADRYYNKFLEAIASNEFIPADEKEELIAMKKREIEHCQFGRAAIQNPRKVVIENLGDTVNSIYPEYAAVVSQDEKKLFFTSRRPDTRAGKKDENGYYEDIYAVDMTKGGFFDLKRNDSLNVQGYYFNLVTKFEYGNFNHLDATVNEKEHEGSIQLDANDSILYFYRDENVWWVPVNQTKGVKAQKMGSHVNSLHYEPSIFFSYDRTKLFVVSDRPGGYGGLDIYISYLQDDSSWTSPLI